MKQMIIEIDENTVFSELPEEQQADILRANIQWPESIMIGTKVLNGKSLLLIVTTSTVEEIEAMIRNNNLSWMVLAVEDEKINQSLLLRFYLSVAIFDIAGVQTGVEPITDLTGKIQTFSGKNWIY